MGFLSMVYHGLFGMMFEPNGIYFAPMKPDSTTIQDESLMLPDTISLTNVTYRQMALDVTVRGSGTNIQSFELDNVVVGEDANHYVPCDLTGQHYVTIVLGSA